MDDEIKEEAKKSIKLKKKCQAIASYCLLTFALLCILAGIVPSEENDTNNKISLFIIGGIFLLTRQYELTIVIKKGNRQLQQCD